MSHAEGRAPLAARSVRLFAARFSSFGVCAVVRDPQPFWPAVLSRKLSFRTVNSDYQTDDRSAVDACVTRIAPACERSRLRDRQLMAN